MSDSTTGTWWASRPPRTQPRPIAELVRAGIVDAELAAVLWAMIEGRVPIIVAGGEDEVTEAERAMVLDRLSSALPAGTRTVELAGATETFEWLPQASELGWSTGPRQRSPDEGRLPGGGPIRPDDTILRIGELSDRGPSATWGAEARLAIRAASIGYGLAATMPADSLEAVMTALRRPPVSLDDDELSRLGIVLVLGRPDLGRLRVVAAHYVRPVARDAHGHVQRLGPAVLATWDASTDRFEHFAWAILPELAVRLGARAGDLELDLELRRGELSEPLATGAPIVPVEA